MSDYRLRHLPQCLFLANAAPADNLPNAARDSDAMQTGQGEWLTGQTN